MKLIKLFGVISNALVSNSFNKLLDEIRFKPYSLEYQNKKIREYQILLKILGVFL